MSGAGPTEAAKLTTRRRGIRLCLLVSDSNSCRSAYRFMKAFLVPALDEVHLITAIVNEAGRNNAVSRQRELIEAEHMKCTSYHICVKEEEYTLFESLSRYIQTAVKPDIIFMGSTNLCTSGPNGAQTSSRVGPIQRPAPAAAAAAPQLRRQPSLQRSGATGGGPVAGGGASAAASAAASIAMSIGNGLLGGSCLALKILAELRCAPVLLAKYNSKGSWLSASASAGAGGGSILSSTGSAGQVSILNGVLNGRGTSTSGATTPVMTPSRPGSAMPGLPAAAAAAGGQLPRSPSMAANGGGGGGGGSNGSTVPPMRVMVDLQPNSRHVLDWLFEHFTAGRDHLVLTVSQAYDDQHNVKPAAQRLLTAFGVQAAVNSFEADTAVLAGPANKSLPQAVMDSEPDLLVLQAPRCKGVPPSVVELLYSAKTSFLIWPPDFKAKP